MLRTGAFFATSLFTAVVAFGQTVSAPSRLEVNLGALPFDLYNDPSSSGSGPIKHCSAATVRLCYQQALSGYAAQGVKSVRFLFALRGGGDSTAMDAGGNLRTAWLNNVKDFLADVQAAGVQAVVPSPHLYSWQNDGEYYRRVCARSWPPPDDVDLLTDEEMEALDPTINSPPTCTFPEVNVTLRFWPTSPFGEWPTYINGDPTNPQFGGGGLYYTNPDAYDIAPANPNFIGWPNILNVFGAMMQATAEKGLNIAEFDVSQEIDLGNRTALGRFIFDTTNGNVNVYEEVRARMQQYGFDPDVVTYSSVTTDSHVSGGDCFSYYGDSGRIFGLSAVTSAYDGGYIGIPFGADPSQYSLLCGGTAQNQGQDWMFDVPWAALPQPRVIDQHSYPCLRYPLSDPMYGGKCIGTQTGAQLQAEANADYSAIRQFTTNNNHVGSLVFIGETHSNAMDQNPPMNLPPNSLPVSCEGDAGQCEVRPLATWPA